MKKYMKYLLLFAAAACLSACELDRLDDDNNTEQSDEVGYLKLASVSLNADTENVSLNGSTRAATRDGELPEAGDTYYLEVINKATEEVAWDGTYSEAKAATGGIPLEPATYVIKAYQDENKAPAAGAAKDAPYYIGTSEDVVITMKQTTAASVTCKLANILTTVQLSADLKAVFKVNDEANPLKTNVAIGTEESTNNYDFAADATHETPQVYFADVAGPNATAGNTMTVVLSGKYFNGSREDVANAPADDSRWKSVKMTKTVTGVKAAQWRKISIDIDQATGNVLFEITIQDLVYDEEVEVDVMTLYASLNAEEVIPDEDEDNPLAPSVTISGQSDLNYAINGTMYNEDTQKWNTNLQLVITPESGSTVASVYAVVTSESSALLSAIATKNDETNDYRVNFFPSNDKVNLYNVATDGTKVTFLDAAMSELYKYAGTHTLSIYTTDSENRTKHTDVVITVAAGGSTNEEGPSILWTVNGATASSVTLQGGETIKASITSETGLTGLSVKIDSNVLTESELSTLDLTTEMDLLNPATAKMETQLRALGFLPIENYDENWTEEEVTNASQADDNNRIYDPTNSLNKDKDLTNDVKKPNAISPLSGKTSITFDVSPFMTMLKKLGASVSTFTISASDSSGNNSVPFTITVVAAE